jgi:hypothetical protein
LEKITCARIEELIKEGNLLLANQGKISLPIVDRMYRKMRHGISFPDIKTRDETICDGHHRYIAARLAGIEIGISPGNMSRSTLTPWESVIIEETDWDSPAEIKVHHQKDADYNGKTTEEIEQLMNK